MFPSSGILLLILLPIIDSNTIPTVVKLQLNQDADLLIASTEATKLNDTSTNHHPIPNVMSSVTEESMIHTTKHHSTAHNPCLTACNKQFPEIHESNDGSKKKNSQWLACHRGCRFFSLIEVLSSGRSRSEKAVKNACSAACSEAYNQTSGKESRESCHYGCGHSSQHTRIIEPIRGSGFTMAFPWIRSFPSSFKFAWTKTETDGIELPNGTKEKDNKFSLMYQKESSSFDPMKIFKEFWTGFSQVIQTEDQRIKTMFKEINVQKHVESAHETLKKHAEPVRKVLIGSDDHEVTTESASTSTIGTTTGPNVLKPDFTTESADKKVSDDERLDALIAERMRPEDPLDVQDPEDFDFFKDTPSISESSTDRDRPNDQDKDYDQDYEKLKHEWEEKLRKKQEQIEEMRKVQGEKIASVLNYMIIGFYITFWGFIIKTKCPIRIMWGRPSSDLDIDQGGLTEHEIFEQLARDISKDDDDTTTGGHFNRSRLVIETDRPPSYEEVQRLLSSDRMIGTIRPLTVNINVEEDHDRNQGLDVSTLSKTIV